MTILPTDFPATALPAPTLPAPGAHEPSLAETLSADARLYLRHVEGGESIRALAREAGMHASTVLRRIRRFESRRDDPLIDGALSRAGAESPDGAVLRAGLAAAEAAQRRRHEEAQTRRILRRLAESGAELVLAAEMEKAVIARDGIRTAILDRNLAETLALKGWVEPLATGRLSRYAITSAGREALRGMLRGTALPGEEEAPLPAATRFAPGGFAPADPAPADPAPEARADHGPRASARHRVIETRDIRDPETGQRRRARMNIAESPLLLLARRRDRDGQPFLTPDMVRAGERLREDFELAQMGPRVAQNWDRFLTAGVRSGYRAGAGGGSDSARDRVALALRDLGPGMGDMVLRVCCYLEGIEMTERRLGWSARSGKIVLRLALERLHRHYLETYGPGSPLIG